MRPFLLLSSRPEDEAADEEHAAVLRGGGLAPGDLVRVRLERGPLPRLRLDDYSGVLLGGSPFTVSDPPHTKSAVQRRVEADVAALLDEVVARDVPFLGCCFGIGTLGLHQGGTVDATHAEPVGVATVGLTDAGRRDPVLAGLPERFDAFVGHKEAVSRLPGTAVLLAGSASCPVQMFRVGRNVYATQFHPELDVAGILTRVRVYRHAGYFPPEELDALTARLAAAVVEHPARILAGFVARHRRG